MSRKTIAVLGAECTGKTTLTRELFCVLQQRGYSVGCVDEHLRDWCMDHQRTPTQSEQHAIASAQQRAIETTTARDVVICDTTPLMTAIYSELLFDDLSLYPQALQGLRNGTVNLLTSCDLPWEADGIQRDGPAHRQRFDARLRQVLTQEGIAFSVVVGRGEQRLRHALRSVERYLSMAQAQEPGAPPSLKWMCERCSDAQCEHRIFRGLR